MTYGIESVDRTCTKLRYRVLGPIQNNVYCVEDGAGGVIVVDPEESVDAILEMADGAPVSAIFVTHRHHDHIGALRALKEATGAPVYASAIDAPGIEEPPVSRFGKQPDPCTIDNKLEDGDTVEVGACTWRAMLTPGHTEGSLCYYLEPASAPNPEGMPLLLSGDTLFHGTIGRTDFEGGSMSDMRASMRKLGTLPDETIVFPGHSELTSIGTERWRVIDYLGNQQD